MSETPILVLQGLLKAKFLQKNVKVLKKFCKNLPIAKFSSLEFTNAKTFSLMPFKLTSAILDYDIYVNLPESAVITWHGRYRKFGIAILRYCII